MDGKDWMDGTGFRVRPLEARDLRLGRDLFPGALRRVPDARDGNETIDRFFDAVASGRRKAWVAETTARIIGLVVVTIESAELARLTYLHVTPEHVEHPDAARALAEVAIGHAWDAGCLKLIVHDRLPEERVIAFMHELGFEFSRAQVAGSERVVEFYRNLYVRPARSAE